MPPRVATKVISETGADRVRDFFRKCAEQGVGPTVATLLAGGVAGAAPLLGCAVLILGSRLWRARQDGEAKRELGRRLDELCGALSQVESDVAAAYDKIAAVAERDTFVWARLDGAEKAEIA